MHITTTGEKEVPDLKESKEACMKRFEGRKGKSDVIIV